MCRDVEDDCRRLAARQMAAQGERVRQKACLGCGGGVQEPSRRGAGAMRAEEGAMRAKEGARSEV